jgi:hypothetical protein
MKVKVSLAYEASPTDPKTSVKRIKRMQRLDDGVTYAFPDDLQSTAVHSELCKITIISKGLAQLARRGQTRNLAVTLSKEIAELYFDSEGNAFFKDTFLDTSAPLDSLPPVPLSPSSSIGVKSTSRSLAKDFVLEKFVGKSQNPEAWLQQFESECVRLLVQQHQYTETFRLFLESTAALDWFAIQLKLLGMQSDWSEWKVRFINNFSPKGWSQILTTYNYRYIGGSLVDFALKKIRLLIDADPDLTVNSRINFVVLGLPENVRNKLNRMDVVSQSDLISELQTFYPFNFLIRASDGKTEPVKSKISCSFCKKANTIHWNHSDSDCFLNPENKTGTKSFEKKPIKVANNLQLDESVPDIKN